MERKGLAVWSVGVHARRNLLPAISATRHWRFAGCTTRNREIGMAEAAAHGGRWFETPDAMLAEPGVAAVLLAGPNGIHYAQGKAALAAGKAVLIEKTLCADPAQTQELIALARANGLLIAECFMYKHHPQFVALRALLADADRVGGVRAITARLGFPHLSPTDIRYSRALSGGALLDAGAYCVSSLDALAPEAALRWSHLHQPAEYEVDTTGAAVFDIGAGAVGFSDWGFGRAYRNEIEIWCERATVLVRRAFSKPADLATTIAITDTLGQVTEVAIPAANHFVSMLDDMGAAMSEPAARAAFADTARRQSDLLAAVQRRALEP